MKFYIVLILLTCPVTGNCAMNVFPTASINKLMTDSGCDCGHVKIGKDERNTHFCMSNKDGYLMKTPKPKNCTDGVKVLHMPFQSGIVDSHERVHGRACQCGQTTGSLTQTQNVITEHGADFFKVCNAAKKIVKHTDCALNVFETQKQIKNEKFEDCKCGNETIAADWRSKRWCTKLQDGSFVKKNALKICDWPAAGEPRKFECQCGETNVYGTEVNVITMLDEDAKKICEVGGPATHTPGRYILDVCGPNVFPIPGTGDCKCGGSKIKRFEKKDHICMNMPDGSLKIRAAPNRECLEGKRTPYGDLEPAKSSTTTITGTHTQHVGRSEYIQNEKKKEEAQKNKSQEPCQCGNTDVFGSQVNVLTQHKSDANKVCKSGEIVFKGRRRKQ